MTAPTMTEPLKELVDLIGEHTSRLPAALERILPFGHWRWVRMQSPPSDPAQRDALALRENYFALLKDYVSRPEAQATFESWNMVNSEVRDGQFIKHERFVLPYRLMSVDDIIVAMAREVLTDEYYYWRYGDDQCPD